MDGHQIFLEKDVSNRQYLVNVTIEGENEIIDLDDIVSYQRSQGNRGTDCQIFSKRSR